MGRNLNSISSSFIQSLELPFEIFLPIPLDCIDRENHTLTLNPIAVITLSLLLNLILNLSLMGGVQADVSPHLVRKVTVRPR